MPVYEYRCKACGKTHEIEHGFHDERPTACPACGGQLARVFHPVGVVFKGSGFHKTDYSRSGVRTAVDGAKAEKPGESGGDKKADSNASETKPASESAASSEKSSAAPSSGAKSKPPASGSGSST